MRLGPRDRMSTDVVRLRRDLPELAEEIVARSRMNPELKEVLDDYGGVCARIESGEAGPEETVELIEIRAELVGELRRVALRLREKQKRTIRWR
jgi:hypothetical protein